MPVVNRAAFAAGVLPPDTSASPRELQLQRDELLEFLGELEEAGVFAAAQQAARAASTPVARDCGQSAPPPVCARACVCVHVCMRVRVRLLCPTLYLTHTSHRAEQVMDSAVKQTQLLSDADAWLMQVHYTCSRPVHPPSPPSLFFFPLSSRFSLLASLVSRLPSPVSRLFLFSCLLSHSLLFRWSPVSAARRVQPSHLIRNGLAKRSTGASAARFGRRGAR